MQLVEQEQKGLRTCRWQNDNKTIVPHVYILTGHTNNNYNANDDINYKYCNNNNINLKLPQVNFSKTHGTAAGRQTPDPLLHARLYNEQGSPISLNTRETMIHNISFCSTTPTFSKVILLSGYRSADTYIHRNLKMSTENLHWVLNVDHMPSKKILVLVKVPNTIINGLYIYKIVTLICLKPVLNTILLCRTCALWLYLHLCLYLRESYDNH